MISQVMKLHNNGYTDQTNDHTSTMMENLNNTQSDQNSTNLKNSGEVVTL